MVPMATQKNIDMIFLSVFEGLVQECLKNAQKSAENIIQITSKYLSTESFSVLKSFYDLYFSHETHGEKIDAMNKSVDDLFDQAQSIMKSGQELSAESLDDTEDTETKRLGLSGLQKRLESLISLEQGLREKLFPVLSSMQFEDATRQRMAHILYGLTLIVKNDSFEDISSSIEKKLSSLEETESYYRLVRKEKPPEGGQKLKSMMLEF